MGIIGDTIWVIGVINLLTESPDPPSITPHTSNLQLLYPSAHKACLIYTLDPKKFCHMRYGVPAPV